jgi:hypothetical protein
VERPVPAAAPVVLVVLVALVALVEAAEPNQ